MTYATPPFSRRELAMLNTPPKPRRPKPASAKFAVLARRDRDGSRPAICRIEAKCSTATEAESEAKRLRGRRQYRHFRLLAVTRSPMGGWVGI